MLLMRNYSKLSFLVIFFYTFSLQATPDNQWHLGTLNKDKKSNTFTWKVAGTTYRSQKTQKRPFGTIKYPIEQVKENGGSFRIGLLKIKALSCEFTGFAFSPGEKDKYAKIVESGSAQALLNFQIQQEGVNIFVNKTPVVMEGRYTLDFQGRATVPSMRNSILVNSATATDAMRIGVNSTRELILDYIPSQISPALSLASAIVIWSNKPR